MRLFSDDASVIAAGVTYLRIMGWILPLAGAALGLMFALLGANRPLIPFLAISVRLIIVAAVGWPAVALWQISHTGLIGLLMAAMAAFAAVVLISSYRLFQAGPEKQ